MEVLRQPLAHQVIVFHLRDDIFHGMSPPGEKGIRPGGLLLGRGDRRQRR